METVFIAAVGLSGLLALNIGANNSAAAMASSYGAGARTKRQAVGLIAVFAILGALFAGGPVVETMGKGIVPQAVFSSRAALTVVVLVIALAFVSWANASRVPVATTHAIVCSIAGIGLYLGSLNHARFYEIVGWWVAGPVVSWAAGFLVGKFLYYRILNHLVENFSEEGVSRVLKWCITVSGTFLAFSAGANNSANAVGPVVGLGVMDSSSGVLFAGVAMAVGALVLGGRVLETVGKEITEICLIRAITVEAVAAVIIVTASLAGIPVSITEIVTAGIVGFSCAQHGFGKTARNRHVLRIAFFWLAVPAATVAIGYIAAMFVLK
ncbi:MAG: inorganic phosphate transporter [Candidatus Dadabacteria bacterium]|nr:inorganic phosphate transporter [Candidatus Dadabacteria bacterium]